MKTCHTCGNPSSEGFEIKKENQSYFFDSFECAVHSLAPVCQNCGCKIMSQGIREEDKLYCCQHCAEGHKPNPG